MPFRPRFLALAVLLALGLAGCDSPEEKAERYFRSALDLLEDDDVDRALVELRNVFRNDGFHKEARQLYADLVLEQGNVQEAYSQYLRLIEQYPDTPEVRRILAELAVEAGNWDEVERHGRAVIALDPDPPAHRVLAAALDYRAAVIASDDPAAAAAAEATRALLEETPGLIVGRRILIDWLMRGPEPARALPQIEAALDLEPKSRGLRMARVQVLSQTGEETAAGEELRRMYEMFPDDPEIPGMLIGWYMSREDHAAAEAFLRAEAGADDADPQGHLTVVQFLGRVRGAEAAEAELARLAEVNAGTDLGRRYQLRLAAIGFASGETGAATTALDAVIAEAEAEDLRNEARILLSQMRAASGDAEGSRALVGEVLAGDPTNVEALKSRAAWRIRADETGAAIGDLRSALDQTPRDTQILLLLAEAQQKAGNVELAQQRLAQAVEVSDAAPAEALVYARFLMGRGQLGVAEQVLNDSFRTHPENLEVAGLLGDVLLRQGNLAEARGLLRSLVDSDNPQAAPMARSLQAALLFSQNQVDESLAFLRESAADDDMGATLQMLRIQVMDGRIAEARRTIEGLRSDDPGNLALRLLEGNLLAIEGRIDAAIEVYREIHAESPDTLIVIERLYQMLVSAGSTDEAAALLAGALERTPQERSLRLLRALELEREGGIDEAIGIYEALYAENTGDAVVANNLASLLSLYRDAPADIDRAYRLALRLTGSDVPAFLDTLGWVQVRREEFAPAIINLQAAARGLPQNPTVAFNLGLAYAAAGRAADARAEIERGLELAGEADVPQKARAEEVLAELPG
ncbi:MAG TPA: tetratricopeptide repeat protein [Pseudohaliea sp.]|nr:tetratricopeptide repeat protein [Pseudohaliea sp.]